MDSDGIMEGIEKKAEDLLKTINTSANQEPTTANSLWDDFDDSFINPGKGGHISSENLCKKILYIPICEGTAVRAWDVLLFLPNLTFVLFLAIRWSSTKKKLMASHSPIFRTFHMLVGVNAFIAVLRSFLSMIIAGALDKGENAAEASDKALWITSQALLVMTEMSVLVFGFAGTQLDSKSSILKVSSVSVISALLYSMCQGILEFSKPDPLFNVSPKSFGHHFGLFGYGGTLYCMVTAMVFATMYVFVVLLGT